MGLVVLARMQGLLLFSSKVLQQVFKRVLVQYRFTRCYSNNKEKLQLPEAKIELT